MKTPKEKINVVQMGGGQYHYVGVERAIKRYKPEVIDQLLIFGRVLLCVNSDGFQFYNSSKKVGWPLLGSFREIMADPFYIS